MTEFCIREALEGRIRSLEREAARQINTVAEDAAANGMGMTAAGPTPAVLLGPEMDYARRFARGEVG